jgi:hypothetical protein
MKESKMKSLTDWPHNSVKGDKLEIVKITDLERTVLGLKDEKSDEVFIVGNLHDLTFILHGNDRPAKDRNMKSATSLITGGNS